MAMREFENFLERPSTIPKIYWRIEGKGNERKVTGKAEYKIVFTPGEEGENGEHVLNTFSEASYTLPEFGKKLKNQFEKILEKPDIKYVREIVKEPSLTELGLKRRIIFPLEGLTKNEAKEIIRKVNDLFGFPQYHDSK